MAHLQIDDSIGCGMTFLPGQIFVFDSIALHEDSAGRLGVCAKSGISRGRGPKLGVLERW